MSHKTTRKISIATATSVLMWLFWVNFIPLGTLAIQYDIGEKSSYVTDFRPGERMIPFQTEDGETFHTLIDSPVFFHVRTPRPFQTATVDITYRAEKAITVSFGDQTGPELFEFVYEQLAIIPDGQWHTTQITVDLGQLFYHTDTKRYQFSFITDGKIDIAGFSAVFEKPPITSERILAYLAGNR